MSPAKPVERAGLQRTVFATAIAFAAVLQAVFFLNMMSWGDFPDRGWIALVQMGPNIVWQTRPVGEAAGLRHGDEILTLNGQSYQTLDERLALLDTEIGSQNVYEIQRGEERLTIAVTNQPLGFQRVALQSGVFWLLGLAFIGMGILVFLMKPYHGSSWAFFAMTLSLGLIVTYFAPSALYEPRWLDRVTLVMVPLLPAALLHLAVLFPQRHPYFASRKGWLAVPYLISIALAGASFALAPKPADVPIALLTGIYLYVLVSILVLLGLTLAGYRRSPSVAVRLQSLVIVTGLLIGFVAPIFELVSNLVLRVSFFPKPILFYLISLLFFPLSIGYAIVRHDLFEIDVIVRRTYGYLLSTATILGAYAITVSVLNLTVGPTDLIRSPFFSVAFILGMVFVMQPVQARIQRAVDRAFYRQQYDYRATITEVSERMTSMLDPQLVQQTLVESVVREMFLENGLLLVPGEGGTLEARVVQGDEPPLVRGQEADLDDVLRAALLEKQVPVFRHEIELAPQYEHDREAMTASFDAIGAELMLPMVYQGEVRAVLSLARKKSGKMFTREDVDLLRTLIAQGSIAMENARLFDEVAHNLKQIQLLESIKSNLSKFVPLTVQTLLEESPDATGLFEKRERDLSVMFADMTGYTRLSAELPMEQVNALIERYFGAFLAEIMRHGGDVNETAGDGLMVLFQDDDREQHARAAVRAAVGIQRLTREINAERMAENPNAPVVGMHIGVNSGVASVGVTKIQGGGGARWTYTASGPITNISARIGALGEEIAITEETHGRLDEAFAVEAVGPQALKNVPEPVMVYRVTGVAAIAELQPAAAAEPEALPTAPLSTAEEHAEGRGRFVILGVISETGSGRPLQNLIVRAFDKDLVFDDDLGHARSDANGRFEIRFTDEFFADLVERHPDIYLKIFDPSGSRELLSTKRAVRWNAGAVERFELEIPRRLMHEGGRRVPHIGTPPPG